MEDSKILDLKISGLHGEIQEIKDILKKMSESMVLVSNQSIQIQTIQHNQQEHHEDIDDLKKTLNTLQNWQASCPRDQIKENFAKLQAWIISLAGVAFLVILVFIGAFVGHVLQTGPK